jgi:ABC-type bacteriocin/lantibiotic exporter with double-glycine peptidase domain
MRKSKQRSIDRKIEIYLEKTFNILFCIIMSLSLGAFVIKNVSLVCITLIPIIVYVCSYKLFSQSTRRAYDKKT